MCPKGAQALRWPKIRRSQKPIPRLPEAISRLGGAEGSSGVPIIERGVSSASSRVTNVGCPGRSKMCPKGVQHRYPKCAHFSKRVFKSSWVWHSLEKMADPNASASLLIWSLSFRAAAGTASTGTTRIAELMPLPYSGSGRSR